MAAKQRKRAVGLDEKAFGSEPIFNPGETPENETERSIAWGKAANWYNYFNKPKDHTKYVLKYAKEELKFSKDKIEKLKLLRDWELVNGLGHPIRIFYRGFVYNKKELQDIKDRLDLLLERANTVHERENDEDDKVVPPTLSPRERLLEKINNTIAQDWDTLIEKWIVDKDYDAEFNTFKLFKSYDLKGPAIEVVRDMIEPYRQELKDAYDKKCDQAIEAYEHIKRTNLRKMIKTLDSIIADLESLKNSVKATRAPRVKKPKASEKQVEKLNYSKESIDFKLTSINPVMIPGSTRLYIFNTKNKKLTELVSTSTTGFEVSGSTIKNFDPEQSRSVTLRKPDESLPIVLNKTKKQIDTMWDKLTTKTGAANGRINGDTILLRAMNK